jgi:hypothetical protein
MSSNVNLALEGSIDLTPQCFARRSQWRLLVVVHTSRFRQVETAALAWNNTNERL